MAYENIYEALQGSEIANDLEEVMLNKYEIASLFYYKHDYKLSIQHFEETLIIARQLKDEQYTLFCVGSIGATYLRIKEPENPGRVMPDTLIMPQKNTNHKLSFSVAGSKKLMLMPTAAPSIKAMIVLVFHALKSLLM